MPAGFHVRPGRRPLSMLLLGLAITLAACSPKEEPAADMPMMASSAALEGQLDIVAWADHVERGESEEAFDWVTQFEADTGCRVNVKVVEPMDDLLALLSAGRPAPSPPRAASPPHTARPRHRRRRRADGRRFEFMQHLAIRFATSATAPRPLPA